MTRTARLQQQRCPSRNESARPDLAYTCLVPMAGRNQHTIPRFLLRGFASSQGRNDPNVWIYEKGLLGDERNIKNVASENYFYGNPGESDLDGRITNLESAHGNLVNDLRRHPAHTTPIEDPEIPKLVAHLSTRTRHVRESILLTAEFMLERLREKLSDPEKLKRFLVKE